MENSDFFNRRKSSTTTRLNPEILSIENEKATKQKFKKLKSSFYDYKNSSQNKNNSYSYSWNEEPLPPEPLGEFYEIRKQIIFNKINIINNENIFAKLLTDSQCKSNNIIKSGNVFTTPKDMYDWAIELKENISNYFLVIHSYLIAKKIDTAKFIFLQMDRQNRDKIEKIYEQINKNFQNMTNSNYIGKFFPTIIKIFLKILSVIIKYSARLNKQFLENYYLKIYLLTIDVVKNTIINKFTSENQGIENDFKNLGRFFYFDCLYKQSIYFFMRYQSFDIMNEILNYIAEKYANFNDSSMTNFERILLMKINYNLGLIYYSMGNIQEALLKFDEANDHLKNIYYFPYITINITPKEKQIKSLENQAIKTSQEKSTVSSINNIDDNIDKIISNEFWKKRAASTKLYDKSYAKKQINFGLKQKMCSVINFGKNKITVLGKDENIENFIREQIYIEIKIIMAEIELNRNNKKNAFDYINEILNLNNSNFNKNKIPLAHSNSIKDFGRFNFLINESRYKKIPKKLELTELNKRRISFILSKIEFDLGKNNNKNSNLFNPMKSIEEIQDISASEYATSRSKYPSCANFQQKNNIFEFDNEGKLIQTIEKFFLFIYSLSMYQLKLLNQFQPSQTQIRDELPILFPTQFKDSLTYKQRMIINSLDTMSLSRCIVLLQPKKAIAPNNLNYYFLNSQKIQRKNSADLGIGDWGYTKIFLKKSEGDKNKNDKTLSNIKNISAKLNMNNTMHESKYKNNLNNKEKNNLKKKLFVQGKFEKFIEEDKNFNKTIDLLINKNDNDKNKINKSKIIKIMNKLDSKDKEILMKDKSFIDIFVKQINQKIKRRNNSCK